MGWRWRKRWDKGFPGDNGTIGEKGPRGAMGQKGEKGQIGQRGLIGERGLIGIKGEKGNKGTTGERGPKGFKGQQGQKGIAGKAERTKCDGSWVYFRGSCYLFRSDQLDWHAAWYSCRRLGGFLAKVDDVMEAYFLKSFMTVLGFGDTYIGFHDVRKEGSFIWEDNSPGTFRDWNPGEPNNAGGHEDCTYMSAGNNYRWNDDVCIKTLKYLCEKNA